MKKITFFHKLLFVAITCISFQGHSQCFEIQTILVDACSATAPTNDEGLNEMVRFRIGSNPLNTSTLSVNWPANGWTGLIQNATTASNVTTINNAIAAAGNCGRLIEPSGGVIPANAEVLLITSQNFTPNLNSFTSLNSNLYIIFQNNTTTTGGHFGNYNATPGTRTLSMTFGAGCTDTVTYERSNLTNNIGGTGGTLAQQDGATVNFTPSGTPSYTNTGCSAPVTPFTANTTQPNCTTPTGTITITSPLDPNFSYSIDGINYQSSPIFSGLAPNNYPVTVKNNTTGCISPVRNVTINPFTTGPNVSSSALNQSNCTFKLTGSSTTLGVTITWNGPGLALNTPNPATATVSGNYTVTAFDPVSGCSNSSSVNIVIGTAPTTPVVTVIQLTCTVSRGSITVTSPLGANLGYSIDGINYQTSPVFSNLIPGNYSVTAKNTVTGCVSSAVSSVINPAPVTPTATPNLFCDGANATPTSASFDFNNAGQTSFSSSYSIDGGSVITGSLVAPSHFDVPGVTQGQAVTFTLTWNGICTPNQTVTCYPKCTTPVTPTFNPVAAICAGDTLSPLPTTSLNGVKGTWTPALNNTATTTYTFTPLNAGECGTTTTLQIVVNQKAIPTFTAVGPVCNGQTIAALPTTSNNGFTGTWSPALDNTATTTYTFTPTAGQCAQTTTMQIVVNSIVTPTFTAVSPICIGQTISALPTTSNNGITGTWSPALNNTATTLYTFTPSAGQCASTATLTITVSANTVTPTFASSGSTICTGQTLSPLPTTSINGITGTWSPALNNTTTTTYTFTPNPGQCALTKTLKITVNGNTITPTFTTVGPICRGQALSPLPTTSNNGITGVWSPALNNTATTTYTFTPNAGQCALTTTLQIIVNLNVTPTFNPIGPICSGQVLSPLPTTSLNGVVGTWSPALNNTNNTTYTFTPNTGQCAISQTLTINVNPKVTPTFNAIAPICSGTPLSALPTTSLNGVSGAWSPAINNTATTTYTFTPNTGQCANTTSLQIKVDPLVTPTITIVQSCSTNTITVTSPLGSDYEYSIDSLPYQSSPVFNNFAPGFHSIVAHQIPANCFSNPANFVLNPVFNDVVVNPTPPALQSCDPNNDGFETFDLTQAINSITGGGPYNVTFHETLVDATRDATSILNPSAYYTIDPDNQTIYVRVESTITACYEIVPLDLIVNPTPEATQPKPYELCDYTVATGYEIFNLTTVIPEILGTTINPTLTVVRFYRNLPDAQIGNPALAISTPTAYQNGTIDFEKLYVRVETIATGCFDIVTLDLIVNPLPRSTQPNYPVYSVCDNDQSDLGFEYFDLSSQIATILLGQPGMDVTFYPSLADAQNGTLLITNLRYRNTVPYVQTIGIRITNHRTGCYVISTMDLRVEPLPSPIPQARPYTLCDVDQDGYTDFDLTTLEPAILGRANYILTFHETLPDAEQGLNAINKSILYTNLYAFVQTLYVRAQDPNTKCVSVMPIELNVNPRPKAPINITIPALCDTDSNPQDQSTTVNLTQATAAVLAQQAAGATYTVTYYTSQAAADLGRFPIIPASSYQLRDGDTIYIRVENDITHCFNTGSFKVEINKPLLLTTPTPISICDDDYPNARDQYHVFDLTIRNTQINQGTGYTVTYYPSYPDAVNDSNPIGNPSAYTNIIPAVQSVGVAVTTPKGCRSVTILDIRVLPIPTANTNPPALAPKCDDNNPGDMKEVFDLTVNAAYIKNGDGNLTLHYFPTQADAEDNVVANEIRNPSSALVGANVWIRVENRQVDYQGNNCYILVEQALKVNPLPVVATGVVHQECKKDPPTNPNANVEEFDLTQDQALLTVGNPVTAGVTYTVAYYEDMALTRAITNPTAYNNTSNPQTIYVVVTNSQTGCKSQVGQYTIKVNPKPIFAFRIPDFKQCDDTDGVNDGQRLYQDNPLGLGDYIDDLFGPTQNPANFLVEFYTGPTGLADATSGNSANALQDIKMVSTGTYYIRLENILTGCYSIDVFDVIIEKLAEPVITTNTGSNVACVDFGQTALNNTLILDSGITAANYTFEWYIGADLIVGETSSTLTISTIDQPQVVYGVIAKSVNPMLGCTSLRVDFTVIRSGPATNVSYTVSDAFSDNQIITVTNQGYGTYEYSLDDGPHQSSPVFENVVMGDHTIYVWDATDPNYSCGVVSIPYIRTIDYPHYFTPNGDGINDIWNVRGLELFANSTKIYIFDRYGKLLKQISSGANGGWDGTFNGHLMPSDDYWFTVDYVENAVIKQFKAHFALKR